MADRIRQPIEVRYNCVGYYGFGGGVNMVTHECPSNDGEIYCSRGCMLARPCWDAHRERANGLFPAVAAEFARLLAKHGGNGQEAVKEMSAQHDGRVYEPGLLVMAGNIEDGASVGGGGRPKDRARGTLPYPFTGA